MSYYRQGLQDSLLRIGAESKKESNMPGILSIAAVIIGGFFVAKAVKR